MVWQSRRARISPKHLVYEYEVKSVDRVQAVCVGEAPSSRCASRALSSTATARHSTRLTKNTSSLQTGHGAQPVMNSATAELRKAADVNAKYREKLRQSTTNNTALKERAPSGTVTVQNNCRCNGHVAIPAGQRQTSSNDSQPPANVKLKKKKKKRSKPDGLVIIIVRYSDS